MVVNTVDGSMLARATMPDGKETYMSPVIHDFKGSGDLSVIFGSGGETISGIFIRPPFRIYSTMIKFLISSQILGMEHSPIQSIH